MQPIRILHVLGALDRGGDETLVMNCYRNIDRSKIQFDFVIHTDSICSYTKEIESLGGKIYSVPKYRGYNHIKYKRAWESFFKRHSEYTIIHGHVRSTASIYLNIAKKYNRITIAHSHAINSGSKGISNIIKNIMQYKVKYIPDYKFACSIEAGKYLFGEKIESDPRFKVINNAIDINKFLLNESARLEYREKLKLNNKLVIGHVGRFVSEKNHDFLLKVFCEIHKKIPNSFLLLVGTGPLYSKFIENAKNLNLLDSIMVLKDRDDVSQILSAMDYFIFPSIFEGFGMAVLEAEVSGLPCMVSDRVPSSVKITDEFKFLPINKKNDINIWMEDFFTMKNKYPDRKKQVINDNISRFDIKKETELLCNEYYKMIKSYDFI